MSEMMPHDSRPPLTCWLTRCRVAARVLCFVGGSEKSPTNAANRWRWVVVEREPRLGVAGRIRKKPDVRELCVWRAGGARCVGAGLVCLWRRRSDW